HRGRPSHPGSLEGPARPAGSHRRADRRLGARAGPRDRYARTGWAPRGPTRHPMRLRPAHRGAGVAGLASGARGRTAPGFVGQGLVQGLVGLAFLDGQDPVDVPLVQGPIEDPPIAAVQERDRLPEGLEEPGIGQVVEQLSVLRLNDVVDDLAREPEVTHDRAGLVQGLRGCPAQAPLNGPRQCADGDHVLHLTPCIFGPSSALYICRIVAAFPGTGRRGGGLDGRAGRSATLFLSRVNMEEHLLRGPRDVGETEIPMKRKSGKSVVDLGKEPAVVHFNVGSGYVSYLESDAAGQTPRVKSVVISREPT